MPDDYTSSSAAIASKTPKKASTSIEDDEQALANMGKMEMSALMVNADEEEAAEEAAANVAAEATAAAEAQESDDSIEDDTALDTDDTAVPEDEHEESEEVEIDLHNLNEKYQEVVASTAPPAGFTYDMTLNGRPPAQLGGQTPEPAAFMSESEVSGLLPGVVNDPNFIPTLSDDPNVPTGPMSPLQRQEMMPAQQPVIARYMLSPPTMQPGALSSAIPAVRPSGVKPGTLPSQQPDSGVVVQANTAAPSSPGTIAAGFGSVARAAPTGLAAAPAPPTVSFPSAAAEKAPDADAEPVPEEEMSDIRIKDGVLQPLSSGDDLKLRPPPPLEIQPPTPELTPSLAATVNPLPLSPFSGELAQEVAPAADVAPARRRSVLDFLPELRSHKAEKIYSSNTQAVWAAQYRLKVLNIVVLTMLAITLIAGFMYWTASGAPTNLQDWPIVKELLSK